MAVHAQKIGKHNRMNFSRIEDAIDVPYLIDIQKSSYQWFLDKGLKEVFNDINPIVDFSGNLFLEIVDYRLDGTPKYSIEECKERDTNYSTSLRVTIRYQNKQTHEAKQQDIFMADFPLLTDTGTFIINGAERVVVNQLVRSPGAYFSKETDKHGKDLFASQLIPNRGAWLEYETDSNNILYVRVDRTRKVPITALVRAIGIGSNAEIISIFGEEQRLLDTLEKDPSTSVETGLTEIYKKLRPGEPATVDSARPLFTSMFFDPKRYDLMSVGRYKFNKKLALAERITGRTAAEDVEDERSGEVFVTAGEYIDNAAAWNIQNAGINSVKVYGDDDAVVTVVGNGTVFADRYGLPFDIADLDIDTPAQLGALRDILESGKSPEEMRTMFESSLSKLYPKTITADDIIASISYNLGLEHGIGEMDDIDHLGNRRLRSVGELLQNQFRIGMARFEKNVKERMQLLDPEEITPQALVNIRPVSAALKEFFGSSQLSQFMDQTNPLAELTHKRRLSALGPGGLTRERAGFEVRDIHHSHYGRICPIETPEGPNIGLIGSLSTFARVNKYGFIETPYRKVVDGKVTDEIVYINAEEEGKYSITAATEPIGEDGLLLNERVTVRAGKMRDFVTVSRDRVDFMDVSPRQMVSIATSMIPFLENDDANRALMGSNMQRQAVPLLIPEAPVVATGIEYRAAKDSGVCVVAKEDGEVTRVSADCIQIRSDATREIVKYELLKFKRSNQGTCINQHPIVKLGDKIKAGDVIADGPSTANGDMALGRNVLIGFMTWEGYNYEDAVILSERLVKDDVYTSIHIEEFEAEARETKLGPEEITREIPNIGEDAIKNLDSRGIIRIGAEVTSDDILVGKVTPKGETDLSPEERLLRAIFGEKAREVRDTSLKVPHGQSGIVVDIREFTRENGDELKPGVIKLVRVYVAIKRKISVGDKMAGRHGNKGVISRILPEEDMPFMADGTPLDIMLSPMGVPSRMNIGQVLEVHLGLACRQLGWEIATPVFAGATEADIRQCLEDAGMSPDGKVTLYDGRTGEPFVNPITVGYMYMLKLHHLVDDKMHARSTGPYSLVTQQPLGGKAQFGGQRFGEMEVWAIEAYGAANVLQEILTVKSDDVVGRVRAYEAIVKGENIPKPSIPESFKVLIKEFQSLCLDIKVLDADGNEVTLSDDYDITAPDMLRVRNIGEDKFTYEFNDENEDEPDDEDDDFDEDDEDFDDYDEDDDFDEDDDDDFDEDDDFDDAADFEEDANIFGYDEDDGNEEEE